MLPFYLLLGNQDHHFFHSVPYGLKKNMSCDVKKPGGSFDSFKEARETCDKDKSCYFILDESCEGLVFRLCESTILKENDSSCVRSKNEGKKSVILERRALPIMSENYEISKY